MRITRRALPLVFAVAGSSVARAEALIRIGTLRFGSLGWELDVMRRHDLVRGFALEAVEFAAGPASQVALLAGRVDIVLQDWLWVSRQLALGAPLTAMPVPGALGAVMTPADSAVRSLSDLRGKRLGVAGGPIDKSWLLLRLYGRRQGVDLDSAVEHVFGPPPLLAEQLRAGRLEAALTYWPFAARGEAQGQIAMLEMADVLAGLGLPRDMPMLGLVFSRPWAEANRPGLASFLAASQAARAILMQSDAEWQQIAPLTGAQNEGELERLRTRYRSGFPGAWDAEKQAAAARLFALLAEVGGTDVVGSQTQLAPGTFWPSA